MRARRTQRSKGRLPRRILWIVLALLLTIAGLMLLSRCALGAKGVSINVGNIAVDEALYPGRSYHLATITVGNTGTETSDYTFSFIYGEGQEELRPDDSWLALQPEKVTLEPGQHAPVRVGLRLPVRVRPGAYFAYLTAHPVRPAEGGVAIGVAAAARLGFEVVPANFLQGMMFRVGDGFERGSPWSYLAAAVVGLVLLGSWLKLRYAIDIRVRRRTVSGGEGDGA